MKIYAVRHGLTDLNIKGIINGGDTPDFLVPEGKEQARAVAEILPATLKHIYCSSLERAQQTAEIINEKLNLPISFHDELKEVDLGILNGTPYKEEDKTRYASPDFDWRPSGECAADVKKRILKILNQIKAESGDGEALIVTHGGIIRVMYFLESGVLAGQIGNTALNSFDLDKILNDTK
jgi:broad specificity phosphatase PhoE